MNPGELPLFLGYQDVSPVGQRFWRDFDVRSPDLTEAYLRSEFCSLRSPTPSALLVGAAEAERYSQSLITRSLSIAQTKASIKGTEMNSSRNRRIMKDLSVLAGGIGSLIAFSLIVHFVQPEVRGVLLGVWILAALPLFLAGLAFQPVFAVAVIVNSFCFAVMYCNDMGGPYVHDFAAAAIGVEAMFCTLVLCIVFLVRLFKSPRAATRARVRRASLEKWTAFDQTGQGPSDGP